MSYFVTIYANAKTIKSLKSSATSSLPIKNNPFPYVIHGARFDEIVKINSLIDICNSNSCINDFNKTNSWWQLSVHDCKITLKPNFLKVRSLNKILLKHHKKLRYYFSRVVKVKKFTMFVKSYAVFLKISIEIRYLLRFLFRRQGASLLIMFKKIMDFLISSIAAKIVTPETFPRIKVPVSCKEFPKKIVIFINIFNIMFFKRTYPSKLPLQHKHLILISLAPGKISEVKHLNKI